VPARQSSINISTFPYKKAGLTSRQAAAHLLSRFTYGSTPGAVDAVTGMGLENWFQQQLQAGLPEDSLNKKLAEYRTLRMTNAEIVNTFPRPAQVLRMAARDGFIETDSIDKSDKKEFRNKLAAYMQQKGLRPQKELFTEFFSQKVLRAAYSNNQLQEVLTDFWFNHFNVSMTKKNCAVFIPAYERDVIRPNVLGKFDDLLLATARSPAMLLYLDNFNSSATADAAVKPAKAKKSQGLNENYAREVMELHTLGVDGGYTQQDVTQAARVLTGWTIYPIGDQAYGNAIRKLLERVGEEKLKERGFVHEGDFLFAMNRHDTRQKQVLGKVFPGNEGYQEGVVLLKMLAHSQSASQFISRKLAARFVNDNPPQSLVNKMAQTFLQKGGDIRMVMITMVQSPEFWSKEALREKTKSPFELAISSVRSLDAQITEPIQLYNWVAKMGQKMYFYQAPTGFPDKGQHWINTGALLNRMNFGLALASQRIPGISFNLLALNNGHEPESAGAALVTFCKIMMPEKNLDETVRRLAPLLNDPDLGEKVGEAASKTPAAASNGSMAAVDEEMSPGNGTPNMEKENVKMKSPGARKNKTMENVAGNNSMLSQVVGIIIGSPEFQRR
jgi:uncharacterized protein (DUF1800 family)